MRRAPPPVLLAAGAAAVLALARAAPPGAPGGAPPPAAAYAQAEAPRTFVFPADHGPHPQYRQEWWYFTGNLDAAGGRRFGFELTFFRFALAPAAAPAATASAWRTREIWMAHFAVTDLELRRFRFAQKLSRAALGLAGAQPPQAAAGAGSDAEALRIWIDDWRLAGSAPAGGAGAATVWQLRAAEPGYALELTLEPQSEPVLNGERGLSRKSAGAASYYYSVPRLAVRGRLVREGRPLPVRGLAWLDREWGSADLNARQSGWDWFGLQLDDGTALMFYALRERDGGRDPFSAGTWIGGAAATRALSSNEVRIEAVGRWTNAAGDRYPSGWRVRLPGLALDLAVQPVLADQELGTTPRYWEGAVDVSGTRDGRPLKGRGYVELVGYAQERGGEREAGAAPRLGR